MKKKEKNKGKTVKAIRFPIMSLEDFVSVVLLSDILTKAEIVSLTRHVSSVSKSPAGFSETTRSGSTGKTKGCGRFNSPPSGVWNYYGYTDSIDFSADKDIALRGVRFFGKQDSCYSVDFKLRMVETATVLMSLRKPMQTKQLYAEKFSYSGFELIFSTKIILKKNTRYSLSAKIAGPTSAGGIDGVSSVQCSGVTFTFMKSGIPNNNGSSVCEGQFPELIFCLE